MHEHLPCGKHCGSQSRITENKLQSPRGIKIIHRKSSPPAECQSKVAANTHGSVNYNTDLDLLRISQPIGSGLSKRSPHIMTLEPRLLPQENGLAISPKRIHVESQGSKEPQAKSRLQAQLKIAGIIEKNITKANENDQGGKSYIINRCLR